MEYPFTHVYEKKNRYFDKKKQNGIVDQMNNKKMRIILMI